MKRILEYLGQVLLIVLCTMYVGHVIKMSSKQNSLDFILAYQKISSDRSTSVTHRMDDLSSRISNLQKEMTDKNQTLAAIEDAILNPKKKDAEKVTIAPNSSPVPVIVVPEAPVPVTVIPPKKKSE